jgi:hypothetical protein
MTAKVRLEADRAELARFVDATFRYADDGTDAVLRTFAEGSNEVLGTVRVPLNGAGLDPIIEHAAHQATKAGMQRDPLSSLRPSQPSSEAVRASAISVTAWC